PQRGPRPRSRRVLLEPCDDQPDFSSRPKHLQPPHNPVACEQHAASRLDDEQSGETIDREFALQEAETKNEAAPVRAVTRKPDQKDVKKRFDVAATWLDEAHRGAWRRQHEKKRSDDGTPRAEADLAREQA